MRTAACDGFSPVSEKGVRVSFFRARHSTLTTALDLISGVAYLYCLAGNLLDAEKALNGSILIYQKFNLSDTYATTPVLSLLGVVQVLHKKYFDAERSAKLALAKVEADPKSEQGDYVLLHALLLASYTGQGKLADVDSTIERITALVNKLPKQERDALTSDMLSIAQTCSANGWNDGVAAIARLVAAINGSGLQLGASAQPAGKAPPPAPSNGSRGSLKITDVLKKVEITRTRIYFDIGWHVDRPTNEKGRPIHGKLGLSNAESRTPSKCDFSQRRSKPETEIEFSALALRELRVLGRKPLACNSRLQSDKSSCVTAQPQATLQRRPRFSVLPFLVCLWSYLLVYRLVSAAVALVLALAGVGANALARAVLFSDLTQSGRTLGIQRGFDNQ